MSVYDSRHHALSNVALDELVELQPSVRSAICNQTFFLKPDISFYEKVGFATRDLAA